MRIKQILIALDQLMNTIFLGGYAQESISSHAYRCRADQPYKTLVPVIDWLFSFWGPDHCKRSYENRMGYLPQDPRP